MTSNMIDILGRVLGKKDDSQTVREYLVKNLKGTSIDEWERTYQLFDEARYGKSVVNEKKGNELWAIWKKIINHFRS